jgi:putative hydrolase of the HAD superfamily
MRRQPAQALLIDLDGVVRRWTDPTSIEASYDLPAGTLMRTAMTWELYRPAVTGEITDAEWMSLVASRLPLPAERAASAVAEWQRHRGDVDPPALAFVREVRAAGRPVGLATNATDRLGDDLDALGLAGEFDAVLSSYEMKIHKPAPEFFARACAGLGVQPGWTLLVDDDDRVIRGARAAGLLGFRWTGPDGMDYLRAALGL